VYLNSFFATPSVQYLALRRLRLVPSLPVIIAPRGEFARDALRLKSYKKRPYLALALNGGLYDNLLWQASAEPESNDIRRVIGPTAAVRIVPDFPPQLAMPSSTTPLEKRPGELRLVFLSRITPMKNLTGAIEMLSGLGGQVTFDIYGPVRDEGYWRQCRALLEHLPPNITARYCGPIEHSAVAETLGRYHFFYLPTLGENFGHAIVEAMACGCPALISDRTPWRDMAAKGVGWDVPLEQPERWQATLQQCVDMDGAQHAALVGAARRLANEFINSPQTARDMAALFDEARAIGGQRVAHSSRA
jgi:glycosyltransferase involved in cell wall biosynthesis